MSTVADKARPAARAVARTGRVRITMEIDGFAYDLKPAPAGKHARAWNLKKLEGPRAGAVYACASAAGSRACTCPDYTRNRARCKHLGALAAAGLLPGKRDGKAVARG